MSTAKQDVILAGEAAPPAFSFADMQRMAVAIAKSNLFGVKEADQALSLMMIAQAEGKHPALIARDYDIIQGRPAKKAEAILRDFQASGGKVEWHELSDKLAAATFSHPLSVKPLRIEWDIARAKVAGLMGKPGGMYEKYPRQMLRSRCISEGCRTVAPSATSGFYTPEEVNQMDAETEAVPLHTAITQATEALSDDQIGDLITSMDVPTLPALEAAFAAAWRATKDPKVRARFKAVYDDMRSLILEAQRKEAQEGQP